MNHNPLGLLESLGLIKKRGSAYANAIEPNDDSLYQKLAYYRSAIGKAFNKQLSLNRDYKNQWRILRSSLSTEQSTQSCLLNTLIADCCILDDPIAKMAPREKDPLADSFSEMLKMSNSDSIDASHLSKQIDYVISISPLIDAGLVCMCPISCIHDKGFLRAIRYDPNCFEHEVPVSIRSCVQQYLRLQHGENVGDGTTILRDPQSSDATSRIIGIGFHNDGPHNSVCQLFHLSEMKAVDFNDDTNEVTFIQCFDQYQPVDQAYYQNWVRQSVNQTVGSRIKTIAEEIAIGHALGARYSTESEFEAQLCSSGTSATDPLAQSLEFIDATSDLICINDAEHLLKIRDKYPSQWTMFRDSLTLLAEQSKSDPSKAKEIVATQIQPQIRELSKACRSISSNAIQGVSYASLTLLTSAATGLAVPFVPALGIVALGGVAGAFPNYREYSAQSRGSDIIWSKILRAN